MLADSVSALSLTAASWQISHEEVKTWQDSLTVYERDIHLVFAQLDTLDSLLTDSMHEQYEICKLSGQPTHSNSTAPLSSHFAACFAGFTYGILSKKIKLKVLQSKVIDLQAHEGSAICATLEDRMSGEHVSVICALLCSKSTPSPESRIQVFLRNPFRSKPRDFVIWGGLHQKDCWNGDVAPNKFQVCRCRFSECMPYAYMFCSDHCHVEISHDSQAITMGTLQALVSMTIQSQLSINQSFQMDTHEWKAQVGNQNFYRVCGTCGVLCSDRVSIRCPGKRLEDLPTTGNFCVPCGKPLNTLEDSEAFESCFKCSGLYEDPRQLRVNAKGVTQFALDLVVYHELSNLLCTIAVPSQPVDNVLNTGNLIELLFKEIHKVLSAARYGVNDLYKLLSDDVDSTSTLKSLIRSAGDTFLLEHGHLLEPVLQSLPQIEVKYKLLEAPVTHIFLSERASVQDLKYKIFPDLEPSMLSAICVLLDGNPIADTVQLSSFNYNPIEVAIEIG